MSDSILFEEWRVVQDFPFYDVSNFGRIRSWHKPRGGKREAPLLLKAQLNKHTGYKHIVLCNGPTRRIVTMHILVLETFVGPCPEGMECRHFPDRDRTNNRLTNLSWGTNAENHEDRQFHGTVPKGEACSWSKLTGEQVITIRHRRANGESFDAIAKDFGIKRRSVSRIAEGIDWSHIGGPRTKTRGNYGTGRLTKEQAREVLSLRGSGRAQVAIAKDFGISESMVRKIWSGKCHAEVAAGQT